MASLPPSSASQTSQIDVTKPEGCMAVADPRDSGRFLDPNGLRAHSWSLIPAGPSEPRWSSCTQSVLELRRLPVPVGRSELNWSLIKKLPPRITGGPRLLRCCVMPPASWSSRWRLFQGSVLSLDGDCFQLVRDSSWYDSSFCPIPIGVSFQLM